MLFYEKERVDDAPKRAAESEYAFLDRCLWPAAQRVREYLNNCFARYPVAEREELASRIRSGDDVAFRSGLFELFLHEYLLRKGCLLEPHPLLPNGSLKRPDFLVTAPDGCRFYLEAVSAADRDDRNQAGKKMIATTLQYLSDATHPNFFVKVSSAGYPRTQPSGRRLVTEVLAWLNTLDADNVIATSEAKDFDRLPAMEWDHEDLILTISAIPCRPDARGNQRRLIGAQSYGARWVDGWSPIRDAVITKARRYGELDLPLVVAVNVETFRLDVIDETQALFGQEQIIFDMGNTNDELHMERAANGAWMGAGGPRSKRCSGAWLFHDVTPYTVSRRTHTLYVNPWAQHQLHESLLAAVPSSVLVEGELQWTAKERMGTVLGLPEEWPE